MIHSQLLIFITLLFVVVILTMLSNKLRVSYPILLVIAGLLISLLPGVPEVRMEPDWVFFVFLPPLLYAAAWNTSWHDFWFYKRPIALLAFGLVIFTATAVAYVSAALIPGFTLAAGFLLGGIISPPDAVAATSVLQGARLPKRIITILEGESLVNDASSLIVFRFALASILTGEFVLQKAASDFFLVSIMGVLIGLAVAHVVYVVHRFLPTSSSIDTALTLITPYFMYIAAEHFHFSGVLAVVSGGLFLSFRAHEILTYESRIQAKYVWETLQFLLNGIVFILIGMQLPEVEAGLERSSLGEALGYGLVISLLIIAIRILWVFPAAYLPRWLSRRIRTREDRPTAAGVFLVGWSGMRGLVSIASALAIPLTLPGGEAFPNRHMILFITFVVIVVTLVFQGLSLPFVIRRLKLEAQDNHILQEQQVRLRMANAVVSYLETEFSQQTAENEVFARVKERYERMIEHTSRKMAEEDPELSAPAFLADYRKMLLELVRVRRAEILLMRNEKAFPEELLREKEHELDLEEARLHR